MKRLLAVAFFGAAALAAVPAQAGTSVAVAVQSLNLEVGTGDASPLNLGVSLKHDLSENVYVGGQLAISLDDDKGAEISQLFGADVGLQHQFSHDFGVYGFVGLGSAEVDLGGANGDGISVRYGAGAMLTVGSNGLLEFGWASLFDDDMDFSGVDVPVKIAGPHVGLGFRF